MTGNGRGTPTVGLMIGGTAARIADALEQLLAERPLAEITVIDICGRAGVGRTAFYTHFSGKDAVVRALAEATSLEIAAEITPQLRATAVTAETIRQFVFTWLRLASAHAGVLEAVSEDWPRNPEQRATWMRILRAISASVADMIERAWGAHPPAGAPTPQQLAWTLVWTTERTAYVRSRGLVPALLPLESASAALTQVYVGSILGEAGLAQLRS